MNYRVTYTCSKLFHTHTYTPTPLAPFSLTHSLTENMPKLSSESTTTRAGDEEQAFNKPKEGLAKSRMEQKKAKNEKEQCYRG